MSTMAGRADRYYIFTGTRRVRVPQDQTGSNAQLDAFAAANGALNLSVETGPPSKPTSVDLVRRYDGSESTRVTVTDAAGNTFLVRPSDLIAA
jgi:hypothetical protein